LFALKTVVGKKAALNVFTPLRFTMRIKFIVSLEFPSGPHVRSKILIDVAVEFLYYHRARQFWLLFRGVWKRTQI